MRKIVISYRRQDSAVVTGRIYDQLVHKFGRANVFKDVYAIAPGHDFRTEIASAIDEAAVFLAVIGDCWLNATDETDEEKRKRIDDPNDFVRIEIEAALKRDVLLIPLLVQGASMPSEAELPETMGELTYRHAIPIREDPDFMGDMGHLIESITEAVDVVQEHEVTGEPRSWVPRCLAAVMLLILVATLSLAPICLLVGRTDYPLPSAPPVPYRLEPSRRTNDPSEILPLQSIALDASHYWLPQQHPDCRAVYSVRSSDDGQTLRIDADFSLRSSETLLGEAIVFVTQGATDGNHVTTFELEAMDMDIKVPTGIGVSFFVKDGEWESKYWNLPIEAHGGWQHVALGAEMSAGADELHAVAAGLKLLAKGDRGLATVQVKNLSLQVRPTNRVPPVKRCEREEFVARCGVDLTHVAGNHDSGAKGDRDIDEGISRHTGRFSDLFAALGNQRVQLVRVPMFDDLGSLMRLDAAGVDGLDERVFTDVDALLEEVKKYQFPDQIPHHEMRVLLVLFDGSLADPWPELVQDPSQRRMFCEKLLGPFLDRYAQCKLIYGVEVLSDPEAVAKRYGAEATSEFVADIRRKIEMGMPQWHTVIGRKTSDELTKEQFTDFDAYTFSCDPASDILMGRRDTLDHLAADAQVLMVAKLPGADPPRWPPLTSFAIQDAFDYGYDGILLSGIDRREGIIPFHGGNGEAFEPWVLGRRSFKYGGGKRPRNVFEDIATKLQWAGHVVFLVFVIGMQVMFVVGIMELRRKRRQDDGAVAVGPTDESSEQLFITVMLPVYQEEESLELSCKHFQRAATRGHCCELLILTEADDEPTIELARRMEENHDNVRHASVPIEFLKNQPRTKPRALLYGLEQLSAETEIVGILDAEDVIDPELFLKVADGIDNDHPMVQGRLAIKNKRENMFSYFLGAEYALLELLQLGRDRLGWMKFARGTTYFFKRELIDEIKWSPWNLTEDLAFNVRCYASGKKVRLIGTTTWEESPLRLRDWLRQRTRWFQGTLQTLPEAVSLWKLGPVKWLSVLQLFCHPTLIPVMVAAMIPLLLCDVASWIFPSVYGVCCWHIPAWLWTTNLILLMVVWGQFAISLAVAYSGHDDLRRRQLMCLFLPILFFVLLPWAAIRAHWRELSGFAHWEKTPHRGETVEPSRRG